MKSTSFKFFKISLKFLVLILCCHQTYGQELWTISRIKGKAYSSEELLRVGDQVWSDENFSFDKPNSYVQVRVNNPLRIKLIIGKCYRESKATTLKDYFIYTDDLATRSIDDKYVSSILDLNDNSRILVVDTLKLSTKKSGIKFSSNHFIYASFSYKGDEINNILRHQDEKLFIDSNIYTSKKYGLISGYGGGIDLYQYTKKTSKNQLKFSNIKFLFVTDQEIKANFFQYFKSFNIPKDLKTEFVRAFLKFKYSGYRFNLDDSIKSIFRNE